MEGGPQEAERMDELEYEVSLVAALVSLAGWNLQPAGVCIGPLSAALPRLGSCCPLVAGPHDPSQ